MITNEQKREILIDFQAWTGGWMPHELESFEREKIIDYVGCSLSTEYDEEEVRPWLLEMFDAGFLEGDNEQFKDLVIE